MHLEPDADPCQECGALITPARIFDTLRGLRLCRACLDALGGSPEREQAARALERGAGGAGGAGDCEED